MQQPKQLTITSNVLRHVTEGLICHVAGDDYTAAIKVMHPNWNVPKKEMGTAALSIFPDGPDIATLFAMNDKGLVDIKALEAAIHDMERVCFAAPVYIPFGLASGTLYQNWPDVLRQLSGANAGNMTVLRHKGQGFHYGGRAILPYRYRRLPQDFAKAVAMVKRPYIKIPEKVYQAIWALTSDPETDVVWYGRRLYTFGNADGGYALMPLQDKYQPDFDVSDIL